MVVWGVVDCKAKVVVNMESNFKKNTGRVHLQKPRGRGNGINGKTRILPALQNPWKKPYLHWT